MIAEKKQQVNELDRFSCGVPLISCKFQQIVFLSFLSLKMVQRVKALTAMSAP